MSVIGVIGAGSWGVALAQLYAAKGSRVVLWARRAEAAQEIAEERRSPLLPGVALDSRIEATAAPEALSEADILLSVVPVQATRRMLQSLAPHLPSGAPLVICSKGVERGTLALPAAIAAEAVPAHPVAVLSGPSFAHDVVRGLPTAVTIAAGTIEEAAAICDALATPAFRPYASDDPVGAQVGGALKNVLAIACGIIVARGLGESARAALVARGFAEMTRLAVAMGARRETLGGLSGLGDLVLTCGSERSRNFAAGLKIGDPGYEGTARGVSEGTETADASVALAARHGVALPICAMTAEILAGRVGIDEGVAALLARPLKEEA